MRAGNGRLRFASAGDEVVPCRMVQQREFVHSDGLSWQTVGLTWRLADGLAVPRLRDAVIGVCFRHEIMRSSFDVVDDRPEQIVHRAPNIEWSEATIPRDDVEERSHALGSLVAGATARPMDLRIDALVRVIIATSGQQERYMILVVPHATWDGVSIRIFEQEVEAHLRGEGLRRLPIQAGDFAAWEQQQSPRCGAIGGADLTAVTTPLSLPRVGRRRPVGFSAELFASECSLGSARRLAAIARCLRTTPVIALLTGFAILLSRRFASERFTVGMADANRARDELRPLLGLLINVHAIDVDLSEEPTCVEAARRIHAAVKDALHRGLPLEQQMQVADPIRGVSPFFDVGFNFVPRPSVTLDGREPSPLAQMATTPNTTIRKAGASPWGCQLILTVFVTEDGLLQDDFLYNGHVFERSEVCAISRDLGHLLSLMEREPQAHANSLGGVSSS